LEHFVTKPRPGQFLLAVVGLSLAIAGTAQAVDIAPHRALYSMSLASAKQDSGVVGVEGTMSFQWGETCDAWTVEQRYKMTMRYAEDSEVELTSSFVTVEAKNGQYYRFWERKLKDGEPEEEVRGQASLAGPGLGGTAEFSKPEAKTIDLAPGVLFPTAHTILLIERAVAGDNFVARKVLDGASEDNAVDVTAVIGGPQTAEAGAGEAKLKSPLLARPSWRARLAFFPPEGAPDTDKPDYEIGMRLLDNGVSRDMLLDYGDFAVRAILDEIEPLPKPNC
jgi:EipB-like